MNDIAPPASDLHPRRMANAIRVLTMDAIEAAQSGHPGMPLGMADVATVLFTRIMRFDAAAPSWPDRDRFVLSAGHGSMLLYSVLHLLGYADLPTDELRRFRQVGARAAGHPELGHAGGIEMTTGPLGQGLAAAVGMALGERIKAATFGEALVNHRTFVIAGDGDLMEGVSQEAITLAGHLRLGRLVVLWDDNDICIDGRIGLTDSTDQLARFAASGWHVTRVDGHDPAAVEQALHEACTEERPSLVACKTVIGYGSPAKADTPGAHSSPFGPAEVAATRAALGWTGAAFEVPDDVRAYWTEAGCRGRDARLAWEARLANAASDTRTEFMRRASGILPAGLDEAFRALGAELVAERPALSGRKASEHVLAKISHLLPELISGSADLTPAVFAKADLPPIGPGRFGGRYVYYGIREHGMAAAMNGLSLEGGLIPAGGTFLAFIDYSRPAVRLAALMGVRAIHLMTHDSIGVGEDGMTHQPVEHLSGLRATPNVLLLRPADAVEAAESWQLALRNATGPSVLALSRNSVPAVRTAASMENLVAQGAYELASASRSAEVSIFSSGSEVHLALEAREVLEQGGIATRVVSVPAMALFLGRPLPEQDAVVGEAPVKIAIEAAVRFGWDAIIGRSGGFVGMTGYGASGPPDRLYEHFGITSNAVVALARNMLQGGTSRTG